MAIDTLGANALASNSVTTAKIAADAVTSAKIPAGAVVASDVADGSVTTAKLADNAIHGRRNIIINGAMSVSQRATSATGVGGNASYPTIDRFRQNTSNTAGRFTMSQVAVTDLPGFANALKLECTTADTSIASNELGIIMQRFEGQDLQRLKKGTSSAESVTVSFYVKGNASATYTLELADNDNNRQISQTFSVTTSWNRVSLTFAGDTSGALGDDNGNSLELNFWIHAGSNFNSGTLSTTWTSTTNTNRASSSATSFFDSTNRTLEITGLQMELGSQSTPFEHRSFADELAACQRYYHKIAADSAYSTLGTAALSTATVSTIYPFAGFNLRAVPTLESSGVSTFLLQCNNANEAVSSLAINGHASNQVPVCTCNHDSNTAGFAGSLIANNNASAYIAFSSEL